VWPDLGAVLLGALCLLPFAIGLAVGRRWSWVFAVAGALCAPVLLELAARTESSRLRPLEDPRLDLYFGQDSGTAPADALARRVRSDTRIHSIEGPETRVMFLGGEVIFEARPDLADQVGLRTAIALQQRLSREVEGVVVPAVFGHALQQLLWFRTFYLDYRPQAVVMGLTRFDTAYGVERRAREVLEEPFAVTPSFSTLVEVQRRHVVGDELVATPADLERALDELDELCRQRGIHLVIATEPGLDPDLLAAAERFVAARSRPLVRDVITMSGEPRIDELVDVLARLLE